MAEMVKARIFIKHSLEQPFSKNLMHFVYCSVVASMSRPHLSQLVVFDTAISQLLAVCLQVRINLIDFETDRSSARF